MMLEREVKRYSAYFRGWCQAFGEHESFDSDDEDIHWLFNDHQAGFVLPPKLMRQLYREVLLHHKAPPLTFSTRSVEVGGVHFPLAKDHEQQTLQAVTNILADGNDFHVFLTSHLVYGTNARIITLSRKKPLTIIYKEIGTLRIRVA